jgi:hypothetical protein
MNDKCNYVNSADDNKYNEFPLSVLTVTRLARGYCMWIIYE